MASDAHNIYFDLVLKASQKPQCKSVWYETRTGFYQIGNYPNPRMDSCFTKQFWVSKLHPTEAAFLCWMSNGIWSILYPKIWQMTQRWIQKTLLVSSWNSDNDLRKFCQTPELLLYEVFHFCRSGIWPTVKTCQNTSVDYSKQARINWIAAQLPSPSHSAIISQLQRHLFQAGRADSEKAAAMQEHSAEEMLAGFYYLHVLSSEY